MSRVEYQELWEHVMSKENKVYVFRIDTIDGVNVYVYASNGLNYKKEQCLKFDIEFKYNMELSLYSRVCENFDEFITLMVELPQLRFDKWIEVFTKPEKRFDTLIRMHNVKLAGEICCVCHDLTVSKTKCNHHMCLECWSQLSRQSCPVCRKCLGCCDDDSHSSLF